MLYEVSTTAEKVHAGLTAAVCVDAYGSSITFAF